MDFIFDYIELNVKKNGSVSLHTWGDDERSEHFLEMKKLYKSESPIMEYNGVNYMVTHQSATNGRGGMDQGSPETFLIKKLDLENKIVVKAGRPKPLENPDFSSLIANLESDMDSVVDGTWHEDNDNDHYVWEEAMKAVYGKDVFDWWNKNTY